MKRKETRFPPGYGYVQFKLVFFKLEGQAFLCLIFNCYPFNCHMNEVVKLKVQDWNIYHFINVGLKKAILD